MTVKKGKVVSQAKDAEAESVYEMYYNYEEPVKKAADYITLTNDEDGVAEAIERIFNVP